MDEMLQSNSGDVEERNVMSDAIGVFVPQSK